MIPSFIKHILIADDDPDNIEIFQSAVGEICPALTVSVAANGAELIGLLDPVSKPDTIVLDLNMPCKSGKECLVEIRTREEFKDVPVVILSTSGSPNDIDYCLKNGANQYLIKPDSYHDLKAIVKNLCSGKTSANIF